jgi:hypothetical protein
LQDNSDLFAADAHQLLVRDVIQLLTIEYDASGIGVLMRFLLPGEKAEKGSAEHTLATSGFTDDSQRLATVEGEGNAINSTHHSLFGWEMRGQLFDRKECLFVFVQSRLSRTSVKLRKRSPSKLKERMVRNIASIGIRLT